MTKIVKAFGIVPNAETNPDGEKAAGWGIGVPVGAIPLSATFIQDQLAIIALVEANAVEVWHPLIVAEVEQTIDLLIGKTVGQFIGQVGFSTPKGPRMFFIFAEAPWPTSSLLGVEALGNG